MRDCGERKGRIRYIFPSWQWGRGSQKVTFELRPRVERCSLGRQGRGDGMPGRERSMKE